MPRTRSHLSDRQAKFVAEYLVDGNGSRAAVAAGYGIAGSRVAAHRLLTSANVSEALRARQTADAAELSTQRVDVLTGLLEAFTLAKEQGNPAAMVSAARECGRLMGYYAPERRKVDMGVADGCARKQMNALSDAELLAMSQGDARLQT